MDMFQVTHKKGSVESRMANFHHHDYYEIFYFLGNEMRYFIENTTYQLNQYDLVFIDKYTYHKSRYSNSSSRERIVTMFDESVLSCISNEEILQKIKGLFVSRKISFSKEEQNKIILESFMHRLLPAYSSADSPVSMARARLILAEILLTIVDWLEKGIAAIEEQVPTTAKEKRIYEIISYINNNYAADISLNLLCEKFYISRYYLCHTFKEVAGISVTDYINRKRLIEAERLLKYSDMSITEISSQIGFNNVSYFISLFNKKYGCTPNSIKKSYRI